MRQLWNEVQRHRLASSLFLAYWALAYVLFSSRWHAPKDTEDIVPPVLLLHALLPFVAGLLAAWWRGAQPGRILGGMMAGASVASSDFVLILLHGVLRSWGNLHSGDEVMEIPAWLCVASLIGGVLGSLGAAGAAVFGGGVESAGRGRTAALHGPSLLAAGALAFTVAVAILVAVIAPVAADTSPGATPGRAVPAFEIMIVLNLYAGVAFLVAKSPRTGRASRPVAAITALLVIALGAILAAAGSAAIGHAHMTVVPVALILSALGNVAAGILALLAVFRNTERIE